MKKQTNFNAAFCRTLDDDALFIMVGQLKAAERSLKGRMISEPGKEALKEISRRRRIVRSIINERTLAAQMKMEGF